MLYRPYISVFIQGIFNILSSLIIMINLFFSAEKIETPNRMQWELLSVVDDKQLGSADRICAKFEKIVEGARLTEDRDRAAEERDRAAEKKDRVAKERDRTSKGRDRAVEKARLEEERDRASEERDRAMERAQLAEEERDRLAEERERAVERAKLAEEERDEGLQRAQLAESRVVELQRQLNELEERERERVAVQQQAAASEQRGPSWEVKERDLLATDEEIGVGGWASVKVAHLRVAAKYLHPQLVYEYHEQLFQREMTMASRVHHPNLLRFLGAKLEGGMAILTELMPTNLRALVNIGRRYPEHRFSQKVLVSIAMDVARALDYLHHMSPDPIIHRDLSSANVLLQPTVDGGWLAKVSDYGTANFQQRLQTVNPGSPVYAAPESHDLAQQSPKMDIYSYGVLLIEMCTYEFPVPERRDELITRIRQPRLKELIQQCLSPNKDERPTAAEIIDYFQHLQ